MKRQLLLAMSVCAGFAVAFSGCSSSLFSDPQKSKELQAVRGDGKFNTKCLNLNLGESRIDVATTRRLVECLNSNDSIHEYAVLVRKLSDEQLTPIVDLLNDELITNSRRLRELDKSIMQMDDRGITPRLMDSLARVLDNSRFVQSGIHLLLQGATIRESSILSFGDRSRRLDPAFVSAARIATQEVADDGTGNYSYKEARANMGRALEFLTMLAATKSYKGMLGGLRSGTPFLNPDKDLRVLTTLGLEYLQDKINDKDHAFVKLVLWGLADGSLFKGFDQFFHAQCDDTDSHGNCVGGSTQSIDAQVQGLEEFIRILSISHRETIYKPLSELFKAMDAPIYCMGATKRIDNMDMFVLNEFLKVAPLDVPSWIVRTNPLKISLANSLCDLPNVGSLTFNQANVALRQLAELIDIDESGNTVSHGRPLVTVAHFTKGLAYGDSVIQDRDIDVDLARDLAPYLNIQFVNGGMDLSRSTFNERYRRLLIHWLGDKGEKTAYTHLVDIIAELARPERGIVGNLLYFLNVTTPDSKDRDDLRKGARILMTLHSDLRGSASDAGSDPASARSIYDVLAQSMLRVDPITLYRFLSDLGDLVDVSDDIIVPFLTAARDALLMNNVSPLTEVGVSVGLNAEKHRLVFDTVAQTADTPEFLDALRLTAKMARNGSLKELVQGILTLFRSSHNDVELPATLNVPPAHMAEAARDLSTKARPSWRPGPARLPQETTACQALDFDVKFGDPYSNRTQRAMWEQQLRNVGACTNANQDFADVTALIEYGLEKPVRDGKTLPGFVVEMLSDFVPTAGPVKDIYDELSDLLIDKASREEIESLNEVLPFLLEKDRYCSQYDGLRSLDSRSKKAEFSALVRSCPGERLAVVQALHRVLGAVAGDETKIEDLLKLVKAIVESPKMPKPTALLYDVYEQAKAVTTPVTPDEKPWLESEPINAYKRNSLLRDKFLAAVQRYEGVTPDERLMKERADLFWTQPQSHKLNFAKKGNSVVPGYASANDLKAAVRPLLDELSVGDRLEWAMKFFFYMYGAPYTPEWWANWFRRAAANVKAIPYYYPEYDSHGDPLHYPGHGKPVVRYVNELDVMELIVLEGDFTLRELGQLHWEDRDINFAIKYLTLLAQSGDDLRPALDAMGAELGFFSDLADGKITGYFVKPEVKRRLFNLTQIYPLLSGMNRIHEFGGTRVNDLGVLRDLFKKVLSATPVAERNKYYESNSLSVIIGLVKAGIMRNAGINMWAKNKSPDVNVPTNPDDDDRNNRLVVPSQASPALRFVIEAAAVPRAVPLADPTLDDLDRRFKINPDAVAILNYLLREDCNRTKYNLPCVLPREQADPRSFDDRYVLIGKLIDKMFAWSEDPQTMTVMKRIGYHGMQLFDRLSVDPAGKRLDVNRKVTKVLRSFVGNAKSAELIVDHLDLFEPILTSQKSVHVLEILLAADKSKKIYGDQRDGFEAGVAFDDLRDLSLLALQKLSDDNARISDSTVDLFYDVYKSPHYKPARAVFKMFGDDPYFDDYWAQTLDPILTKVMHWFPKEPGHGGARQLRPRLQRYLADHIDRGDVAALVTFLARESLTKHDEFYDKIRFLGTGEYVRRLTDFIELMSSGPKDIYPVDPDALVRNRKIVPFGRSTSGAALKIVVPPGGPSNGQQSIGGEQPKVAPAPKSLQKKTPKSGTVKPKKVPKSPSTPKTSGATKTPKAPAAPKTTSKTEPKTTPKTSQPKPKKQTPKTLPTAPQPSVA